jgi:phosphonate transport system substrate-binding protein
MKTKLIILLACISIFGCKNKLQLDSQGIPETLVIGVFAGDDPQQTGEKLAAVGKYLERKLNIKVEIVKTSDYTAVIEALHAKKVHMAYLSPFSYVLCVRKCSIEPLVNIGMHGKTRSYKSVIATHESTGIKTMDDVKSRSKTLTVCFSDPASTSGHLIPAAHFLSVGLNPQTAFKQKLFASGHGASAMTVLAKKTDIGCFWDLAIPLLEKKGIAKEGELVVLWESDPIVSDPIVIRKDLNEEFIEKVRSAFLSLPTEEHKIFQDYLQLYYTDTKDYEYIVAYDSMYDGIRRIEATVKEANVVQQ